MDGLEVTITSHGHGAVVSPVGEVDAATAPQLLDAILRAHQAGDVDVTVDLAGVSFIDSRGLATLVRAHRHLVDEQRRLRLVNPRTGVAKVLAITGVAEYIDPAPLDQPG